MIKNLVFDLGQVIFSFRRKYIVERFVTAPEDSALLQAVVFDRLYWDKLDTNEMTDEEALLLIHERLPVRLHSAANDIFINWIYNIPENEGMTELIREMKKKSGIRTFVLSNMPKRFVDHVNEFPYIAEFEKCVFSSVCGFAKPQEEIYEFLCSECKILPEETLFIDDRQANIDAAERCGISGYRFDGDVPALRKYLTDLLSNEN